MYIYKQMYVHERILYVNIYIYIGDTAWMPGDDCTMRHP